MRLLVLGGTVFLSKAVAAEALRRGHQVTCACRGESGQVPMGATLVTWDRTHPVPDELLAEPWDAVVDVARHPSWVQSAIEALPDPHWVFVSTVNVYADDATPDGGPGRLPLHEPITDDVNLTEQPDAYGPMKVACEQLVLDGAASAMVVRPGLIVGPEDPTGRFSYWPRRIEDGGEVLCPGSPGDLVQVIDVRDLAAWIVAACRQRTTGVFDAVGEVTPLGDLLEEIAHGVGPIVADGRSGEFAPTTEPLELTWVDQDFLTEHEVQPWAGPDAVPLWLPRPAYDGILTHDPQPALDAGLILRPVADSARDTLAWLDGHAHGVVTGIPLARERELLEAWHARDGWSG